MASRFWILAALASCTPLRAEEPRGALFFAGGALRHDNAAAWNRFVELAGGKGAAIAVIPAAANDPAATAAAEIENFTRYGLKAEVVPIAPNLKDVDLPAAVKDPANLQKLRQARGIWFSGGDQRRITRALLQADGSRTPALDAIWDAYRAGAVLGGTSAGAAIMSRQMFADALGPLDTIKHGITKGKHVAPGLGFLGDDWFVDQHFLQRGRFARALLAMRDYEFPDGIGVDEDTAVVFHQGVFEVIGYKGAVVLNLRGASTDRGTRFFNLQKARLTYLASGDRLDVGTRAVTVNPRNRASRPIDPNAPHFTPGRTGGESYFADILAPGVLVEAMAHALDSKDRSVKGLAFAQPDQGELNDLGFVFRLYRGADTRGWHADKGGYNSYTIVNVYLDITPVRLANPVERALER